MHQEPRKADGEHDLRTPRKMKAAIRSKYGTPEVLSVRDLEIPAPKENEVLIRVHATTVNRTDCHVLWGKPLVMRFFTGLIKPRFASTGFDFAGQIEALGKNVHCFQVGDKVMGFGGVFGCGSHAQYLTLPCTKAMVTMPGQLSFHDAAACLEGALYAASNINAIKPKAGQQALVHGATGAIGSAQIQILRSYDVAVTGVCQGKDRALAQSLGAERVIDYNAEDFTNDSESYDFVFDAVGKSTFNKCKRLLKKNGLDVSSAPNLVQVVITRLFGHKQEFFSHYPNIITELRFVKNLIEQDRFKPVIDTTFPLDQIADAYRYVSAGRKIGNVILTMDA